MQVYPFTGLFTTLNFWVLHGVILPILVLEMKACGRKYSYAGHHCVFPGHLERRGLVTLRRHRCAFPEAHGRYLESPQVLQQHSAGGNGPGARGPKDRLVQPLCTPPFLWSHGGQLWSHADESHKDPQQNVQSKVKTRPRFPRTLISRKLKWAVSFPFAFWRVFLWAQVTGWVLWVGRDWSFLITTLPSQTSALRTQFSSSPALNTAGRLQNGSGNVNVLLLWWCVFWKK